MMMMAVLSNIGPHSGPDLVTRRGSVATFPDGDTGSSSDLVDMVKERLVDFDTRFLADMAKLDVPSGGNTVPEDPLARIEEPSAPAPSLAKKHDLQKQMKKVVPQVNLQRGGACSSEAVWLCFAACVGGSEGR